MTTRRSRGSECVDRAVLRFAETGEQRRARLPDSIRGPSWGVHSIDTGLPCDGCASGFPCPPGSLRDRVGIRLSAFLGCLRFVCVSSGHGGCGLTETRRPFRTRVTDGEARRRRAGTWMSGIPPRRSGSTAPSLANGNTWSVRDGIPGRTVGTRASTRGVKHGEESRDHSLGSTLNRTRIRPGCGFDLRKMCRSDSRGGRARLWTEVPPGPGDRFPPRPRRPPGREVVSSPLPGATR